MNTPCVQKKMLVLSPFFHHESTSNRPRIVSEVLSEFGSVDIITTDFDHQTKKQKIAFQFDDQRRIYYIPTLRYHDNVSILRFLSHLVFSFRAWIFFMKQRCMYDVVYATLPLNLLVAMVFFLSRDKIKIVDVVDIWPDVLPFPKTFKKIFRPFFSIWKRSFGVAVAQADFMLAVSDRFLRESLHYFKREIICSRRIYIGSQRLAVAESHMHDGRLTIAYVGNIGRLYDFQTLLAVFALHPEKYRLHLVGEGDRRIWLIDELDRIGIEYKYFGTVYDESRLINILSNCDIGFNGYSNTTAAFSYKSNTYFAAGLPILNSMTGDLRNLILKHSIGFNYLSGDIGSLSKAIQCCSKDTLIECSMNVKRFFDSELDLDKVKEKLAACFTEFSVNERYTKTSDAEKA